ncbi:MAG: GNAT family N-acetyltransferase [Melioribacteraceae bacterium]
MKIKLFENDPFNFELIRDLFIETFKRDFNPNYWKWRFSENPLEAIPNIAYIEENGKLIGFYAVSEARFVNGNELLSCGLMNAAMIHPNHEGKGLFAKMEVELHDFLLSEKGFSFLYGFANHNAHRIHRKHAGWKDILLLNLFYSNSLFLKKKLIDSDIYEFSIHNGIDYDFIKLDEMIEKSITYGFTRNVTMLKWRLKDPRNTYKVMEIRDKINTFLGIVIFKQYTDYIDIMNYYYVGDRISKFNFLKFGLHYLSQVSIGIYTWANLHSDDHVLLESLGFQEREFNTYLGYISNSFDIDREKIHFSFLDSDVY